MRTDQTSLCTTCALRFAPAARCPSCAGEAVDLRDAAARRAALPKLLRPRRFAAIRGLARPAPGCLPGAIVSGIVVLTLAAMIFGTVASGTIAGMLAFILVPIITTLAWMLAFGEAYERAMHRMAERRKEDTRVRIPVALHTAPLPEPGGERVAVHGRIRLLAPVESPLGGGPCAAFRLVGRSGGMAVDDAGLGTFEVVGDPSGDVLVEGGAGAVALRPGDPAPVEAVDRLSAFLEPRTVTPCSTGDRLSESLLREGDSVVVEATPEERPRANGYRGATPHLVLIDRPGSPLVIRRAE